jgi:uncharacterized membrane protein
LPRRLAAELIAITKTKPVKRIQSIDTVRGLIMIIMTLDHSRDFLHYPGPSPLNLQTTTVILFFTRWITHFCAPTFVFLSGVSAFLAGRRRNHKELSRFLIGRGAWLILSDLLIISFLFSFNAAYPMFVLEVLWAIGCGMIVLGVLIRLQVPRTAIAVLALLIFFGHNLLDQWQPSPNTLGGALANLFLTGIGAVIPLGAGHNLVLLYAALPWTGALLLGYVFGFFYSEGFSQNRRQKILLVSGITFILLFVVLRLVNHYGDPAPWSEQRNASFTLLSFLNATKQPPSLLFLLMTLGPVLVVLSLAERVQNGVTAFCRVYGNVPYFYFIIHLCLLRVINIALILASGLPMRSAGDPLVWQAPGFGYPLWMVYLFWIAVVALLYLPCRWYGSYKRAHTHWWLSFI